jgi:hypothetical protein
LSSTKALGYGHEPNLKRSGPVEIFTIWSGGVFGSIITFGNCFSQMLEINGVVIQIKPLNFFSLGLFMIELFLECLMIRC